MTSGIGEPVGAVRSEPADLSEHAKLSDHADGSDQAGTSEMAGTSGMAGTAEMEGTADHAGMVRYQRQLALPGFGVAGQHRLGESRMLVVGAGGLGSAVVTYLAAAGVGALSIVDDDVVHESNLPRQILYRESDLGHGKAARAAAVVRGLNRHVEVHSLAQRITADTVAALVDDVDIVIDACDNWATRLIVSEACVRLGRPHVWAAVDGYRGQASVWWPPDGPCYRCVFPDLDASSAGLDQSTRQAPGAPPGPAVLGTVPGMLGLTQASEAIKLVTGVGEPLIGRLVLHDAAAASWHTIAVRPRPDCPCRAVGERMEAGAKGPVARPDLVAEILDIVARVPAGRVVTYGDIAGQLASGGPRQVGAVLAEYGQSVPWWRVVNASGRLPSRLWSDGRQRWLQEGTPRRAGEPPTVDLGRARWVIGGVVGPR